MERRAKPYEEIYERMAMRVIHTDRGWAGGVALRRALRRGYRGTGTGTTSSSSISAKSTGLHV